MGAHEQLSITDLKETDIFDGLSNTDLEPIVEICDLRTHQSEERCVVQGAIADELGIVNEGKFQIEIRLEVPPYAQTLNVATLTKGNAFAWSALVEPHILSASVRCVGKGRALYIKASDLQRIFREKPSVERVVMKNLATIVSSRLNNSFAQLRRLVAQMIRQER